MHGRQVGCARGRAVRRANLVGGLYHFGRSVSDLARAFRLMGEGAYDRLHAANSRPRSGG